MRLLRVSGLRFEARVLNRSGGDDGFKTQGGGVAQLDYSSKQRHSLECSMLYGETAITVVATKILIDHKQAVKYLCGSFMRF